MTRARLPLALLILASVAGCKRPHQDMAKQDKYQTYDPSNFFADGTSARPLVAGVVARPDDAAPGYPFAAHQPSGAAGFTEVAPTDARIPVPVTADVIRRGRDSFNIFCAECHGRLGNGEGMIVQRGFTRPPSFHVARLKNAPDAHFYNVITQGYGAMFSYNDRVPAAERWEIVAYIRALQAAPDVGGATFSQVDREALISRGDRDRPPAGGGR